MKINITLVCLLFTFLAFGCDQPVVQRQYKEVYLRTETKHTHAMDDPHAFLNKMPQDDVHANLQLDKFDNMQLKDDLQKSVDTSPLSWKTPEGWTEEKGSSMRLATFRNTDANYPIETTIVSLGGTAGGLSANVVRWMQQVNLEVPANSQLEQFLGEQQKIKTDSGLNGVLIDLTQLQGQASLDADSMLTAIIEKENSQIFVKMMGSIKSIQQNRDQFKTLVQSIRASE